MICPDGHPFPYAALPSSCVGHCLYCISRKHGRAGLVTCLVTTCAHYVRTSPKLGGSVPSVCTCPVSRLLVSVAFPCTIVIQFVSRISSPSSKILAHAASSPSSCPPVSLARHPPCRLESSQRQTPTNPGHRSR